MAQLACYIPRWYTHPKTVTHPGTNRTRRALTSFMRRTPLTTTPRHRQQYVHSPQRSLNPRIHQLITQSISQSSNQSFIQYWTYSSSFSGCCLSRFTALRASDATRECIATQSLSPIRCERTATKHTSASVRPSVTSRYRVKTAKHMITRTTSTRAQGL